MAMLSFMDDNMDANMDDNMDANITVMYYNISDGNAQILGR